MVWVISLFEESAPFLLFPGTGGVFFWLLTAIGIGTAGWALRRFQPRLSPGTRVLLGALAIAAPPLALFFGFRILLPASIPIQGQIIRVEAVYWMVFSAMPWVLASGLAGPAGGVLTALVGGFAYAIVGSHDPFTPLIWAASALAYGILLHQRYRTPTYRLLRRPLAAAVAVSAFYPFFHLIGASLWAAGPLAVRLDFAFRLLVPVSAAGAGSILLAGLVAELARLALPRRWPRPEADEPTPAERSLETRSVQLMGFLIAAVVILLSAVGWLVAYRSTADLTRTRMTAAAGLAAEGVPNALEIGQSLILAAASNPALDARESETLEVLLQAELQVAPYFNHLILVDGEGQIIAESAAAAFDPGLTAAEAAGAALAVEGVPFQYYTSPQSQGDAAAFVSFITPAPSGRILIGRSDLNGNPFTLPILASLNRMQELNGQGLLVDETGLILYHPAEEMVGSVYSGEIPDVPGFFEATNSVGERSLVFAQSGVGRSWLILVEVPLEVVQQQALAIAAPLIGLLLALAAASLVLLRVTLRFVTASLRSLSVEAEQIARERARLSTPLEAGGEDEVGRMRRSFERMRVSLKSRMDEQDALLQASHGVAGSLDFSVSVKPLLAAALSGGAQSARVILYPGTLPKLGMNAAQVFGAGSAGALYSYLDTQILHLCRSPGPLVIPHPVSHPRLDFPTGTTIPRAILGIPLRQEDRYFGALWTAYADPDLLTEDEVRFIATLGVQGALAAANASLFQSAVLGRERLAAILSSTPDPVIVTDQDQSLLLANPAAWQAIDASLEHRSGVPVRDLIEDPQLLSVLLSTDQENAAVEIHLKRRVFVAKATSVISGGRQVGRVCVLRDVTKFKELDELKSEFIQSISHDLGSPLSVIRGYVAMLPYIGNLTEEQESYIEKVLRGVDRMGGMIKNLVELGRIDSGFELQQEAIRPGELLAMAAEHVRILAERKGVSFEMDLPSNQLPEINGDRAMLERALINLVENGVKYTPSGGRVALRAQAGDEGKSVWFVVEDSGIGISMQDQERLFERFFRSSERAVRRQSGSGLGLSIVRSVADRHHGRIWVESSPGRGSTFTLAIPVGRSQSSP